VPSVASRGGELPARRPRGPPALLRDARSWSGPRLHAAAGRRPVPGAAGSPGSREAPTASRHAEWSVLRASGAVPEGLHDRVAGRGGQVARAVRCGPLEAASTGPANRAVPGTRRTIRRAAGVGGQGGVGPGTDRWSRHLLRPQREQDGDGSSRPPDLRSVRSAVTGPCSGMHFAAVTRSVGPMRPSQPTAGRRTARSCTGSWGIARRAPAAPARRTKPVSASRKATALRPACLAV
jgi:hypothetical protein